jgi:FkbM family methyltransferase
MKIIKEDNVYLIDDRWYSPTNNSFLISRLLDRVCASVSYQYAIPKNSIDDRFMDILNPDMIVVDIGSTTGEYVVGASQRVKHVYAIEASPVKYKCLTQNCKLHHLDNVQTFNYAVSNTSGEIDIYDDNDRIFGGSVYGKGEPDQLYKVQAITLNDFLKNINVDVLKLTVNGHEPDILLGADQFLSSSNKPRYILFQTARHEETLEILEKYGYVVVQKRESCVHDLLQKRTIIILVEYQG